MNTKQKTKWWVDVAIFGGFIVLFFLDFTGVALHQWIGVACGVLAAYHLITHWDWVKAVTRRMSGASANRAELYYMIDAVILAGFAAMIATGLVISTWLNLALASYSAWRAVHIIASVITLLFVVVKLGLHWRWIVTAARNAFARPALTPQPAPVPGGVATPRRRMGRREFLSVVGVTGVASLLAANSAMHALAAQSGATAVAYAAGSAQTGATAGASTASSSGASSSSSSASAATGNSCVVRCNRGCSYPGACRRYTDSNGNSRCDFGECL